MSTQWVSLVYTVLNIGLHWPGVSEAAGKCIETEGKLIN